MAPNLDATALSVRQAAWLARVNDDTIRSWIKHSELRASKRGGATTPPPARVVYEIAWDDLDDACARHGRTRPLPAEAWLATHEEWVASRSAETRSPEPDRALLHEIDSLRRALRERMAGASHARADAASADRAIGNLLDGAEARIRDQLDRG